MNRVRSERKIKKYIQVAEELINTTNRPDKLIKMKEFIETLKCDEIDPSTLCRFGCPRFYLKKVAGLCDDTDRTATYSAICSDCWYLALTEDKNSYKKKPIRKPDEEGFKELLDILGYKEGTDFNLFLQKIKKAFEKS